MLLCKIFGHDFISSTFKEWKKDGINFICERCGKRVLSAEDTLWRNRNKNQYKKDARR